MIDVVQIVVDVVLLIVGLLTLPIIIGLVIMLGDPGNPGDP